VAIFLFTAMLLFSTGVFARPTTTEEAKAVVRNWLLSEARPMNAPVGAQIEQVKSFADASVSPAYYVVFLKPAGLVFVPADDLVEPIVGFVSDATSFDPSLSNPLEVLVSLDIPARVLDAREVETMAKPGAVFPAPGSQWDKAQHKWDQLTSPGSDQAGSGGLTKISDVRIAPMVQSRWSQTGAGGSSSNPCYNYYTPPKEAGNPNNYPCGCTATAMAQIMRYFQFPAEGVGTASFTIQVDGQPTTRSLRGGDGAGGPYNWSSMPYITNASTPVGQCQAIGTLTADSGVSIGMRYTKAASGAWQWGAFTKTFGYSNAFDAYNSGDNFPEESLLAMVNPNLDARHPALINIWGPGKGNGGHSVVCDGYGYNWSTLYHHLNMGWLGQHDAWYNLPAGGAGSYKFNSVNGATYNIFISGTGEIISGRATDSKSNPIEGATVAGTVAGGEKYSATTDANGIYALFPVPSSSTVNVYITKKGYSFQPREATTGRSEQMTVTTGNVWGVDFVGSTDHTVSHFSVSTPSSIRAGKNLKFTVMALDTNNKKVKNYSGTVRFTSSDPSADLPADSTLTNGVGRFLARFATTGSQTITATDTDAASITGTSRFIKVR
jgi:hypothetical protein